MASGVFSDVVFRFDPLTETLQTTPYRLPYGRQASSAVYLGGFIYLFGGRSTMTALMTQIVRFNPVNGLMTPMNSVLPTGRYNMGEAAMGGRILLVGGYDYTKVRQILSFDPVADTITVLPTLLPVGLESTVAVPFGSAVFLLGGSDYAGQRAEILRFETTTNQFTVQTAALPYAAWQPAPFVIDGKGYLYGGQNVQQVIKFDPISVQAAVLMGVSTAGAPAMSSCTASLPGRGYGFGGWGAGDMPLDQIVRFVP